MDKKTVLERFQDIKELEVADGLGTVADVLPYFCKNVDEALLRLEEIDNADPSEALVKFKDNTEMFEEIALKDSHSYKDDTVIEAYVYHSNNIVIERALLKAQEQEKVLNIIKEKNVDVGFIRSGFCRDVNEYNAKIKKSYNSFYYKKYRLIQDEYNSIKEIFKDV